MIDELIRGSLGEIIGAMGVIATVIYLAVQIRKQTDESRLAATRQLATQYQDVLRFIAAYERLSKIWLRGIKDYKSLPDTERLRISLIFHDMLRNMEVQFFHTKNKNVEASFLDSINLIFCEFLTWPGVQQWWEVSKHGFENEFREQIERQLEESKTKSYASTFGTKDEDAA